MAEESKVAGSRVIQLTRQEQFNVHVSFEEVTDPHTPEDQLEDVTNEIFESLGELTGCQMLCKPELELFETMSSFEVLDEKMD